MSQGNCGLGDFFSTFIRHSGAAHTSFGSNFSEYNSGWLQVEQTLPSYLDNGCVAENFATLREPSYCHGFVSPMCCESHGRRRTCCEIPQ